MKIVVTGAHGQLGRALVRKAPGAIALDVDTLDIREAAAVERCLRDHAPDVVINAAAYTAVDKAESERDAAFAVNASGAAHVAQAAAQVGARLLHVSTDYVFDGTSRRPYREDDPVAPLGAYGESKAEGERGVRAAGGTVVRTSWLFGAGGPSFVHTIARLAKQREVLRVVADQHGCPTWTDDLAVALLEMATWRELDGVYHYCNAGATTWHAFAVAIVDEARKHGPVRCERVEPIATSEYPTAAPRPAYSVLDTSRIRAAGIEPPSWQIGLAEVIAADCR